MSEDSTQPISIPGEPAVTPTAGLSSIVSKKDLNEEWREVRKRERIVAKREQEMEEREKFLVNLQKQIKEVGNLSDDAAVKALLISARQEAFGTILSLAKKAKNEKLRFDCAKILIEWDQGKAAPKRDSDGGDEIGAILVPPM